MLFLARLKNVFLCYLNSANATLFSAYSLNFANFYSLRKS